jgi:hypothetical protein
MRREYVVGLAAKQQIEALAEKLAHRSAELGVKMWRGPAAELEAVGRILLGTSGSLHDAVKARKGGYDNPAHAMSPAKM